ncbi:MAG: DUF5702 domain-containing protein [Lachnoclostridium sp.]|nr:DUF5702 domain-containing protein [Lachnoclostridium sp.]
MDNDKRRSSGKGSITVFFTLVFMLVFALTGTSIEITRYKVCEVHAYRTLKMAAESLFTEYNRPLYDEYQLFLIEEEGKPFEVSVAEYAAPTLESGKEDTIDLLEGAMTEVDIQSITYVGDNEAAPLKTEIKDFMSQKIPADVFHKAINRYKEISSIEQQAKTIEEKVENEREAAESDISRLELMTMIDGICISNGHISGAKDSFAKMFLTGEKKAQTAAIHHPDVWKTVKDKTISISQLIEKLPEGSKKLLSLVQKCSNTTKNAMPLADKIDPIWSSTLKGNQRILQETIGILERGAGQIDQDRLKTLWRGYDTKSISFDYTGLGENSNVMNPKNGLSKSLNTGILNIVLEKPDQISEKSVSEADVFCKLYKSVSKDESNHAEQVNEFIESDKMEWDHLMGDIGGYIYDEFCMDQYIKAYFGNGSEKKGEMKKALEYECEYILSGKNSDSKNLESIANRLLLIRTVANFGSLFANSRCRNEAYAAAAAIVGFTGMEFLVRLTQTLLLLTWAMAEGLVDVAALFGESKVPVIKSANDMKMTLPEILTINHDVIQNKAKQVKEKGISMNYKDYLTAFLSIKDSVVKRYRMLDIIQWNMVRNHNSNFHLQTCVYAVQMQASFQFRTKFFHFPVLENMLQRKLNWFYADPSIIQTY